MFTKRALGLKVFSSTEMAASWALFQLCTPCTLSPPDEIDDSVQARIRHAIFQHTHQGAALWVGGLC